MNEHVRASCMRVGLVQYSFAAQTHTPLDKLGR